MRTAIYHGPETNIGRHGTLNEGETIQFFETEIGGIIDDSRFEFLPDESGSSEVKLRATPQFDLRTINWGLPVLDLDRRIVGLGLTEIQRLVSAMESLGCFMPVKDAGPYFLSDSIIVEATRNGWTKLTPEEILASPAILEVAVVEEPDLTEEEIAEADRAHSEYLASLPIFPASDTSDEEEDEEEVLDDGESVEDAIASRSDDVKIAEVEGKNSKPARRRR